MGSVLTHMQEAIAGPSLSEPLTKTSKFLLLQGVIYLITGLNCLLAPDLFASIYMFEISDAAPWRMLGMEVCVVAYFYIMSARTNSRYFATTTVLDRIILGPIFAFQAMYLGAPPVLSYTFAFLEPMFAILTSMSIAADDNAKKSK
jgi:uncharacterized membrane protein HdeD (DUF308 family)